MTGYLYIVVFSIMLIYTIIRDAYLFKKGQYNPYPFRKGKRQLPNIVKICIVLIIMRSGISIFTTKIEILSVIIFLCYSFCLIFSVSILNFLSYIKIKDSKIISQTIIFNIMIIVISIGIWKYILM